MRRMRLPAALAAGLLLTVGTIGGAAAAQPAVITIGIDFDTDPATEVFTIPGGVPCATGVATSDYLHFGGNGWIAATFHLTKTLVCSAGTLTIRVNAGANFRRGGTTGGWSIVDGTGAFAGWSGGGNIVGRDGDGNPYDLVDSYYGTIHP